VPASLLPLQQFRWPVGRPGDRAGPVLLRCATQMLVVKVLTGDQMPTMQGVPPGWISNHRFSVLDATERSI